jgi:hypothetical protein
MAKAKSKGRPYRYRWAQQCVCGSFLPRPHYEANRVACTRCGQEYDTGFKALANKSAAQAV